MSSQFPNTIFCDEAGFTGNDLLVPAQPFFVFSSVAIDPEEAASVVRQVMREFRLQGRELKGKRVLNSARFQDAALWIIEKYASNARIFISKKTYALAAKFFEYTFEPVLSAESSIFYSIKFHRYMSNLLYLEFFAGDRHTKEVFSGFERMMRSLDLSAIDKLALNETVDSPMSHFLRQVLTFVYCHRPAIERELQSLRAGRGEGVEKWILELSMTALFGLLAWWGERVDGLEVLCDNSKPITSSGDVFDVMINRKDKAFFDIDGVEHPITFNLASPIRLVTSVEHAGVQIADVFASSIAYSLKFPDDPFSNRCQEYYDTVLHSPVFPDFSFADLNQEYSFVNALVLDELVRRTMAGESIFRDMPLFILDTIQLHKQWLENGGITGSN